MNDWSVRVLLHCFKKMRCINVNITVKALLEESGLGSKDGYLANIFSMAKGKPTWILLGEEERPIQ